ncbi:MAG: epoxyqueuosine reductase QueH [Coriobacteriales bacterium]|nr:epoxyqueuosine reductase QueH [Coriobacteriales bacterium]
MEKEKILLHACCGVCALEPARLFVEQGKDFAIDYTNSNIAPKEEYEKRKFALIKYVCKPNNIKFIEGEYNNELWKQSAGLAPAPTKAQPKNKLGLCDHPNPNRCRMCYRQRFEEIAHHAKMLNFTHICTTLTISPYQLKDVIFDELERAAKSTNLQAKLIDFSPYYREATRISKENGMYRQNYCGCIPSIKEAEDTRRKLRELKKAKKQNNMLKSNLK